MKIKCFIYPLVTIILWSFITLYRIVDDLCMKKYDSLKRLGDNEMEKQNLENDPVFLLFVKIFLVIHTFLSATRGIFYGLSFIVFEEKIFFNFFRKIFSKENKNENKEIIRNTYNSSSISDLEKEDNENEAQKISTGNIEMNDSNYASEN